MVQQRSFQKYVSEHHENDLFDAVMSFIPDNLNEIHLWSYNIDVDKLDEENITFDDMKVEQVFVNGDTLTNDIEFDVLVSGAIYFSKCDRHNDYEDSCIAWFRINCRATIDGELKNFKVHEVKPYDKKQNRFQRRLSDALVPIIFSEDNEFEAEQFLNLYFPEAMEIPQRIDPLLIAEKMGLKVEYREISEDGSVLGQIYFHDTVLNGKEIKAKTILIDSRVIETRGIGGLNNTIMHECVHWHKHRLAFELVRLFEPALSNIAMTKEEFDGILEKNMTPTDWMEKHASKITPKILMPKKMFQQEVETLMRPDDGNGMVDQLLIIEETISELAKFFSVSKLSAKIRMVELGYEIAIGAYNYVDGRYVPPHSWKQGAITANQTYSIGVVDATIETLKNPRLHEQVLSGDYCYVESHMVINSPEYIEQDLWGNVRLTDYARHHMNECCLVFTISVKSHSQEKRYVLECVLNRDDMSVLSFQMDFSVDDNMSVQEKADKMAENRKKSEGLKKVLQSIAGLDFRDALVWLMSNPDTLTISELEQYSGLSGETIKRMRNKDDYQPSLETVIATCIGMQLNPKISFELIEKSGLRFVKTKELHLLYEQLLCTCFRRSIHECNELLGIANQKPLSGDK